MPTYEYQAENIDGKTVTGVVVGTSLDQAVRELSVKGLMVLKIGTASNPNDPLSGSQPAAITRPSTVAQQVQSPNQQSSPLVAPPVGPETKERSYIATSVVGPLVGKVALTNLLFFFRQLATMLEAGVPIVQAIDTLVGQTRDPHFKTIVQEIRDHVAVGRSMSAGMQRYPEVFSPIMMSLIRAGEEGGFLDSALSSIANFLEKDIALRNLYKRLTFYPKLQLGASIVIILAANYIIASIGGNFRLWSPLTTPATWIILTPICVFLFLFSRVGLANSRVKYNYDAVLSNIPGLGTIMRQMAMARFGRAFGALHRGGVPMARTVQLASDACGNEWLRSLMQPAARNLDTGAGITETLTTTGAFSPIVLNMIATGETTGKLDTMVDKMADFYEDEAETKSTQLAKIVGVCVSLLVAIYIAIIVINFWTGYSAGFKTD